MAQAQAAANTDAARQTAMMNRVNQVTPYGSLTYSQQSANPDLWTATQALSPAEQNNLNLSNQAQDVYGRTALAQLGQARGALSTPINTDYSQVRDQYIQSQMGLLDPAFNQQENTLRSRLANQGVAQGSDAYNNAMREFTQSKNQAYAQILGGAGNQMGQAIQQQIALRDQPVNEASALLTGQQVQGPQFTNVPQTQVNPTDYISAYNMAQNAKQANFQAQTAAQQGKMGGVGSIVGSVGAAAAAAFI